MKHIFARLRVNMCFFEFEKGAAYEKIEIIITHPRSSDALAPPVERDCQLLTDAESVDDYQSAV